MNLFSPQRRRAAVEAALAGPSPAWRQRTGPHHRRPEDISDLDASCRVSRQLPPEGRRSHLVSHLTPDKEVEIEIKNKVELERSSRLALSWVDGAWLGCCPQVKR